MLRRFSTVAALVTAAILPFGAAAQDDGGMSFGEEDVKPVEAQADPNDPNAKILAEGKALYEQKKFDEASLLFYKVLQTSDPSAELFHGEAQYELGKTLYKMKLYQGALSYFGKIVEVGETHPFFIPTLRGLVLLTDEVPEDPLLMERLAAYRDYVNSFTLFRGTVLGVSSLAAVFHILNHAAFKASLFMAAGIIDHETGTRDIRRLSGLYKAMPITGTLAMVASGAMAGVPLLNGFLSKEMFFAQALDIEHHDVMRMGVSVAALSSYSLTSADTRVSGEHCRAA